MGVIQGNLSYTMNGRKRKSLPKKSVKSKYQYYSSCKIPSYETGDKKYPSVEDVRHATGKMDTSFQREISAKYTVAPAYNKGAYQVISRENVKDIGR
ncbi:MAG: hypothetical protein ACK559_12925 [bacterium]|jgi:hypothetical protein